MSHILTIAGSPSASAKSSAVLAWTHRHLRRQCVQARALSVRNLPAEDLLYGRTESAEIQSALCEVEHAEGIVLATPIRQGAYSGALKTFLDLLPADALTDKVVLPIATGGTCGSRLALDYAIAPVLAALGASQALPGVYIPEAGVRFDHGGGVVLDEGAEEALRRSLDTLLRQVRLRALAPFRFEGEALFEAFER